MQKPSERIYEIFCREWSNKPHHNDFDKRWGALMDYIDEQAEKSPTPQHLTEEEI